MKKLLYLLILPLTLFLVSCGGGEGDDLQPISVSGCTDSLALNYDNLANLNDSSCCYVSGCMDSTALNYNSDACQDDGSCLVIGNFHNGGIIFYLDGNGGGLVASSITEGYTKWGCYGTQISGADGIAIGTGAQNTIDIVNAGCGSAAAYCANLTHEGYSDWFLPSIDELNEMYLTIGPSSPLGNVGNFISYENEIGPAPGAFYWSSTESGSTNGYYANSILFTPGYFHNGIEYKNIERSVKAIRSF